MQSCSISPLSGSHGRLLLRQGQCHFGISLPTYPVWALTSRVRLAFRCTHARVKPPDLPPGIRPRPCHPNNNATAVAPEPDSLSKPEICTADELHYVAVPGTDWRLALWRYLPPPHVPRRNRPLLLLSGVGTNAIGFDLDPKVSFARFMSEGGFDTWILEVRGAGLSKRESKPPEIVGNGSTNKALENTPLEDTKRLEDKLQVEKNMTTDLEKVEESSWTAAKIVVALATNMLQLTEHLTNLMNNGQSQMLSLRLVERILSVLEDLKLAERFEGLREKVTTILKERQSSALASQIADLSIRLVKLLEDSQRSVSPSLYELQEKLTSTVDEFHSLVELSLNYDWDFDTYLKEDVPAAVEYIRSQSKPIDGRVHGVGHSMGGILLYAMLASQGDECCLASVVTLASSLDYGVSNSSLKRFLPLADPTQALNVPVLPLGALMAAVYPLASRPPFAFGWLTSQVSAQDMMDPKLFEQLVLTNFCTVPAKVLLQLASVFHPGGLCNRVGNVRYKENLPKSHTPVLAVAGDEDLICPPEAVLDTVKSLPGEHTTYKIFGGEGDGCHYGHYDLVCGRLARRDVHPVVQDFLAIHDNL